MTRANLSSRELLEIIGAREKELTDIRNAAAGAAAAEVLSNEEKLTQLRNDFEHNLRVLVMRDATICSLNEKVAYMEHNYQTRTHEIAKLAEVQIDKEIQQIKSEMETEFKAKFNKKIEHAHKATSLRFDEMAKEKEAELNQHFRSSLIKELEEQERRLIASFERTLADTESRNNRKEQDLLSKVSDTERKHEQIIRDMETNWQRREVARAKEEAECRDQMQKHALKEASHVLRDKLNKARTETEQICGHMDSQLTDALNERTALREETASMRKSNSRLLEIKEEQDQKIGQLLDALREVDRGYARKQKILAAERDELLKTLHEKGEVLEVLKADVERRRRAYESNVTRLKMDMNDQSSQHCQAHVAYTVQVDKLEKKLAGLEEEKNKTLEEQRRDLCASKDAAKEYEKKAVSLQEENWRWRKSCEELEKKLDCERQSVDRLRSENADSALRFEKMKHDSEQLMRMKAQDEMELERKMNDEKLKKIARHKEAAEQEKSVAVAHAATLEAKLSAIRIKGEVTKNEDKVYALTTELQTTINDNVRLKNMISIMRKDMELLTSASSSSQTIMPQPPKEARVGSVCSPISNNSTRKHLETQLLQCRSYLDLLLGASETHSTKDDEVMMLRAYFRELQSIVDNLRNENNRILSTRGLSAILTEESRNITNDPETVSAREKELEEMLRDLSSELEIVLMERDQLIELSNKLRAHANSFDSNGDNSGYHDEASGCCDDSSGGSDVDEEPLNGNFKKPCCVSTNDLEVEDLAKSLWANAISQQKWTSANRSCHKATDRATESQKRSFLKLSRRKKENQDPLKKEKQKVRNWNDKDDDVLL